MKFQNEALKSKIDKLQSNMDKELISNERFGNKDIAEDIVINRSLIKRVYYTINYLQKLDRFINGELQSEKIMDVIFDQDSILVCYLRTLFGITDDEVISRCNLDEFMDFELDVCNMLHNYKVVMIDDKFDDFVDDVVSEYINLLKRFNLLQKQKVIAINDYLSQSINEKVINDFNESEETL